MHVCRLLITSKFLFQCTTDTSCHSVDIIKVQMTFWARWSTDNDERYFGFHNCLCSNSSCRHQSLLVSFLTKFSDTFLDDSRFALIHQAHLIFIYINTNHLVAQLCQTCRAYATYVAEAKNTNVHNSKKCIYEFTF